MNKAQKAAFAEVKELLAQIDWGNRPADLDAYSTLDILKAIEKIVREYELDATLLKEATEKTYDSLMGMGEHLMAAEFAKKHGL